MLIDNNDGNYRFIRGGDVYSFGTRAHPGFAINAVMVHPLVPLERGYRLIERYLADNSRPLAALCGIQLRMPKVLSRESFDQFNRAYLTQLKSWNLQVSGANPVARTNMVPVIGPMAEPMIAGFFHTAPMADATPNWLLSGVPEFTDLKGQIAVAAPGDTSTAGLRIKAEAIFKVIAERLRELEASWGQATAVNIYTIYDLHTLLEDLILPTIGDAAYAGLTTHHGRPPITGLDLEIDAWASTRQEIVTTV